MTTSGITTYSVSRNDIIKAALRALKVLATGEDPTTDMITEANQALNMLIKSWQAKDVGLWLNQLVTVTLFVGTQSYKFGPLGGTGNTTRPLDFIELRLRDSSGSDTPVELVSREEYFNLNLKSSQGNPSMAYYDPQMANGVLYIWPTADDATKTLVGTAKYPVQIFNNLNDTPDFPEEWFRALKFNLAKDLIPEYDVPDNHAMKVVMLAQEALTDASDFDREHTSVRFVYRNR